MQLIIHVRADVDPRVSFAQFDYSVLFSVHFLSSFLNVSTENFFGLYWFHSRPCLHVILAATWREFSGGNEGSIYGTEEVHLPLDSFPEVAGMAVV